MHLKNALNYEKLADFQLHQKKLNEFKNLQFMSTKFRTPIGYLICGVLLFASSCQGDSDEAMIEDIINEINALPETVQFPTNNPYSEEKFLLGRTLFWDPILSGSKDVACASCHHPDLGYADGRELSSGVNGEGLGPNRTNGVVVKRNSPTIINTGFNGIDTNGNYDPDDAPMFWDNRAFGLEEQALLPILSHEEMRGTAIAEEDIVDTVLDRINAIPAYQDLFAAAFGENTASEATLAQALATFQRGIVANNSPFDRYMRGDFDAMSNQAIDGMHTFIDVGCANCHNGPMFSDFELHTLSVPDHPLVDDDGANGNFDFRTPTLRNLNSSAPYMHNGVLDDLEDVLEFYDEISGNNGDSQNSNVRDNEIDEDARRLRLNRRDMDEIVAFLNALNDDDFDKSIPESVPSGLSIGGDIN